jgi:RHS repeat-associated protein
VAEYDHVNARLLYYTPDQINSTRVVTDAVGNAVYSATYDPYGNVRTETGSINPMLKFSGKERDAESQLDYFGARYYDRKQYRFISVDPKFILQLAQVDTQRWNLYSYCGNRPVSYIDPNGAYPFAIHFSFTYALARAIGMPSDIAKTIAGSDAFIDLNPSTTSFLKSAMLSTIQNAFNGISEKWHFPSDNRIEECLSIADTTYSPVEFGKALHTIQDAFSHDGYSAPLGHGLIPVDDPKNNPIAAADMGAMTLDLLSAFNQRWIELATNISVGLSIAFIGMF